MVENEGESEDGLTIVSSAASNDYHDVESIASSHDGLGRGVIDSGNEPGQLLISSANTSPPSPSLVESSSPYPALWQQQHAGAHSVLSMSTADSEEGNLSSLTDGSFGESMMGSSATSSVCSTNMSDTNSSSGELLSLAPSSVPSSELGTLPSVLSRQVSMSSSSSSSSLIDQEKTATRTQPQIIRDDDLQQQDCSYPTSRDDSIPEWFSAIETEQDWETWRNEMIEVLAVLGELQDSSLVSDPSSVDPDLLLAALLSQQEDLLDVSSRPRQSKARCQNGFWKGITALVAASALVPAVALALVAAAGRRRV